VRATERKDERGRKGREKGRKRYEKPVEDTVGRVAAARGWQETTIAALRRNDAITRAAG